MRHGTNEDGTRAVDWLAWLPPRAIGGNGNVCTLARLARINAAYVRFAGMPSLTYYAGRRQLRFSKSPAFLVVDRRT